MTGPPPVRSRLSAIARLLTRNEVQHEPPADVEEPISGRLRLVAGYFQLIGVFASIRAFLLAVGTGVAVVEDPMGHGLLNLVFLVAPILTAIGFLWTARELRNRNQSAWIPAMITLAMPLIAGLSGSVVSWLSLATAALGLLVMLSVRKELD
jgi:hypothetical protein